MIIMNWSSLDVMLNLIQHLVLALQKPGMTKNQILKRVQDDII